MSNGVTTTQQNFVEVDDDDVWVGKSHSQRLLPPNNNPQWKMLMDILGGQIYGVADRCVNDSPITNSMELFMIMLAVGWI